MALNLGGTSGVTFPDGTIQTTSALLNVATSSNATLSSFGTAAYSYYDIGLSASMTLTSSSSKVLIIFNASVWSNNYSASRVVWSNNGGASYSTAPGGSQGSFGVIHGSGQPWSGDGAAFCPASGTALVTSAGGTNFIAKVQVATNGGGSVYINYSPSGLYGASSITIMEIKG